MTVSVKRGVIIWSLFITLLCPELHSEITSEAKALIDFISAEEQQGALLTYTQSYANAHNERGFYTGTLYTGIRRFSLDGCKVTVSIVSQNRSTGVISTRKSFRADRVENTGLLVHDVVLEYRFALDELAEKEIQSFAARPSQLRSGTKFECEWNAKCELPWIRLTSTSRAIQIGRKDDGFQYPSTTVTTVALPMAAGDSAARGAKLFKDAVRACGRLDRPE
jgi:hypothetical protein